MAKLPLPRGPGAAVITPNVYGSSVAQGASANVLPNKGEGDGKPEARQDTRRYTDKELLEEARAFLDHTLTAESDNRTRASELLYFAYKKGKQWPDKIRRERENENRPALEINMMPSFINQVVNDARQNRPAIKVRGASDDATVEMAEIRQDLIRHIEYESNAGAIYDNGYRYSVASGIGYWRVCTDYERETSFDQKILLKPINNVFSVYFDPDCVEPDGSDAEKCLVCEELDRDEYRRRYPDSTMTDFQTSDPATSVWIKPDSIRVADYLHKVYYRDTLYKLNDGSVRFKSDGPPPMPPPMPGVLPMPEMPWPPREGMYVAKREVDRCQVAWEVINGYEILETHEWPGTYIPVIPCFAEQVNIEGEKINQPLIDKAQDSQIMFNYMVTKAAEGINAQPVAPFIVAEGQIDGRERRWGEANSKPNPYLVYRKYDEQGKELGYGPPQRSSPDIDMTGVLNSAQIFQGAIRLTTGIADPLSQMQVEDQSGRAILAKERIGNTATFHFVDNLSRAIRLTGKVILDLIPHYYDAQRVLQLLRENGEQYTALVNAQGQGPNGAVLNDLTSGSYDVIVDTGPSYASKRAEAANSMMEVAQADPTMWQIAGDLMVKNMDWPGAEDIAKRKQVMLPPPIQMLIAQQSKDPEVIGLAQQLQQVQQQAQQGMQAAGQQLQQLQNENQQLKGQNAQLKANFALTQAKVQRESMDAQADVTTQMMESQDVRERLQMDKVELSAKIKQEDRDFALQVFDRALQMIQLQQKQMQPVAPEAAQMDIAASRAAGEQANGR